MFGRFMTSVSSSCLVRMLFCWMSPLVLMMFLELGLSGLGLLRLHLLMLIGLVVGPFLLGVWFLAGVVLRFVLFDLVVIRYGRLVVMLLMCMMLLMSSCIVRRRFKAVMDVLGAMIRSGISLSRSVELTAQWNRILALGLLTSLEEVA